VYDFVSRFKIRIVIKKRLWYRWWRMWFWLWSKWLKRNWNHKNLVYSLC